MGPFFAPLSFGQSPNPKNKNVTGGGGGGAASSKNVVAGTFSTIYATDQASVNTGDAHWDSGGSGRGGDGQTDNAVRGRVVLVIRGEATVFDSTGSEVTFVVD